MTREAFHKNKNPEIEKIKAASLAAKHLGPFASDKGQEAFKLLRSGVTEQIQVEKKSGEIYKSLEQQMNEAIKQKEEFHDQIKRFHIEDEKKRNQIQTLKNMNKEFWEQQIKNNADKRQRDEVERKEKMELWTIETHTRANDERRKASNANHAVKEILD